MMPKDASDAVKVGWFFVTYLLYDFTCTLTEVPMQSMVTTLTDNPSERNNILTVKGVISVVAAIGMSVIVTFLLSEKVGVPLKDIAIVGSLVFLVFMLPMAFKVQEHNTDLKNVEHEGTQEKYSFKDMKELTAALNRIVDLSAPKLPDSLIQEFVEVVTPIKDNLYRWKLNFGPQIPHAERTDLTKIEQDPLLKFRINFETARQYRQKNGMPSQFRRCSWTDLRVEVYV